MDLVLLALEPAEESADALVVVGAFDYEPLLLVRELGPWDVETDLRLLRGALQIGELRAIVRFAPRLDRALLDRFRLVRHDEVHVELDDVAEPMARRAGAERVVEREQARLRIFVRDAALAAFEPLGEHDGTRGWRLGTRRGLGAGRKRPRGSSALEVRRLDGIGQPLAELLSVQLHAIDDDLQRRAIAQRRRLHFVDGDGTSVDQQAREAFPAQRGDRCGNRRRGRAGFLRNRLRFDFLGLLCELVDLRRIDAVHRRLDDREIETDEQPRAGRQLAQPRRDDLGRFAYDFAAAASAERAPDARIEQPHVVVDLSGRADGRARVADAVLLPDRNRRRDTVDAIDVGLLHPLQELARIGRQRLDVAPLPFRVNRVEGERRLPRAADAGHDDQRADRQRDVDILEVVGARAADDEISGRTSLGDDGIGHARVRPYAANCWGGLNHHRSAAPYPRQPVHAIQSDDELFCSMRRYAMAIVVGRSAIGISGLPPT